MKIPVWTSCSIKSVSKLRKTWYHKILSHKFTNISKFLILHKNVLNLVLEWTSSSGRAIWAQSHISRQVITRPFQFVSNISFGRLKHLLQGRRVHLHWSWSSFTWFGNQKVIVWRDVLICRNRRILLILFVVLLMNNVPLEGTWVEHFRGFWKKVHGNFRWAPVQSKHSTRSKVQVSWRKLAFQKLSYRRNKVSKLCKAFKLLFVDSM